MQIESLDRGKRREINFSRSFSKIKMSYHRVDKKTRWKMDVKRKNRNDDTNLDGSTFHFHPSLSLAISHFRSRTILLFFFPIALKSCTCFLCLYVSSPFLRDESDPIFLIAVILSYSSLLTFLTFFFTLKKNIRESFAFCQITQNSTKIIRILLERRQILSKSNRLETDSRKRSSFLIFHRACLKRALQK